MNVIKTRAHKLCLIIVEDRQPDADFPRQHIILWRTTWNCSLLRAEVLWCLICPESSDDNECEEVECLLTVAVRKRESRMFKIKINRLGSHTIQFSRKLHNWPFLQTTIIIFIAMCRDVPLITLAFDEIAVISNIANRLDFPTNHG